MSTACFPLHTRLIYEECPSSCKPFPSYSSVLQAPLIESAPLNLNIYLFWVILSSHLICVRVLSLISLACLDEKGASKGVFKEEVAEHSTCDAASRRAVAITSKCDFGQSRFILQDPRANRKSVDLRRVLVVHRAVGLQPWWDNQSQGDIREEMVWRTLSNSQLFHQLLQPFLSLQVSLHRYHLRGHLIRDR